MKKALILSFLVLMKLTLFGQYLVIDDSISGGNSISFQDTSFILANYDIFTYNIDLDQDSSIDIRIKLEMTSNSTSYESYISILPFNQFQVIIDTAYQDSSYYYWSNDSIVILEYYTRTVPKRYNKGDTVFLNQLSGQEEYYISYYESETIGGTHVTHGNISHFYGDTSYIALIKNNETSSFIYYLKVFLTPSPGIHLISAKSNDEIFTGTDEFYLQKIKIYPNPVSENISFTGSYNSYDLYTIQGALIRSENLGINQQSIQVSDLSRGFYLLRLKDGSNDFTQKIIKL